MKDEPAARVVEISGVAFGGPQLCLIAGPCVIESVDLCLEIAEFVRDCCASLDIGYVFKASFDKANRTSAVSARGPGIDEGLAALEAVRTRLGVPLLTDIHESWQAEPVAAVVDILQIPAFLCRQTDLLAAAAATGRAVNVKKGQFLAPWDMRNVVQKLEQAGSESILVTERGACFGYSTLVTDFRSLPQLRALGWPVIFDATHSVQQPGGLGGRSGGERKYVPALTRAAVAVGVDALFLEVHPDPDRAPSDGPNMLPLESLRPLLETAVAIRRAAGNPRQ